MRLAQKYNEQSLYENLSYLILFSSYKRFRIFNITNWTERDLSQLFIMNDLFLI